MNFKIERGYSIGGLKKYIYLLPKNTNIVYDIDGGFADITANDIYLLEGENVTFVEELNENGNFYLSSTISIEIQDISILPQLRMEDYYVVYEDMMSRQYIQCVENTSRIGWEFELGENKVCTLSFTTDANVPSLYLRNGIRATQQLISKDCGYRIGKVDRLQLTHKDNIIVDGERVYKTILPIYDVEYIKNGVSFKEEYKDDTFVDTLSFTYPLTQNNNHINLEEFTTNRYIALLHCDNSTYMCGNEFGMFAKYNIQTSEDKSDNTITITLTHISQSGLLHWEELKIEEDTRLYPYPIKGNIYDPLTNEKLSTELCYNGKGVYTLYQLKTITNIPTDQYICLYFMVDVFENFNIVETYSFNQCTSYPSVECQQENTCNFVNEFPTQFHFTEAEQTIVLEIECECDWVIEDIPNFIELRNSSGEGGKQYNVEIKSILQPTDVAVEDHIVFKTFGTEKRIPIIVQKPMNWIYPTSDIKITAREQVYTLYHDGSAEIESLDVNVESVEIGTNKISIYFKENTTDSMIQSTIAFRSNMSGKVQVFKVYQDRIYEEWRVVNENEYICENGNSYKVEYQFQGYFADNINTPTNVSRLGALVSQNDNRCTPQFEKWEVVSDDYICLGTSKYTKEQQYTSTDNVNWTPTDTFRSGELIETNSVDCKINLYYENKGSYIVEGGKLIYQSNGNEVVVVDENGIKVFGDNVVTTDWFYMENGRIHCKYDFVGDSEISAFGIGNDVGGEGGSNEELEAHTSDKTVHITANERAKWNMALNSLDGGNIYDDITLSYMRKGKNPQIKAESINRGYMIPLIGIDDTNQTDDIHIGGGEYEKDYDIHTYANRLIVNSDMIVFGEVNSASDARLKENINNLSNRGYVNPIVYTKDDKQGIGFIAQDVQQLYPELVTEDKNGYLYVNYAQYTAVLQSQIIELSKKITELENRLNDDITK